MSPSGIGSDRAAAGQRFAADLKRLREERGLGKRDVTEALRLAEDVVDELEESALINNPTFNRVYLRSLYASYAALLGVDSRVLLDGIEEAMAGTYDGRLTVLLEGGTPPVPTGAEPAAESTAEPAADPVLESPSAPQPKPVVEDANALEAPEPIVFTTAAPDSRLGQKRFLLPNMRGLATAILAGLVLFALIWFAVAKLLSDSNSTPERDATGDSTSLALEVPSVPRPDPVVLPDTMTLFITARTEQLDPVRVAVDEDIRRPYWVELDSTISFRFTNRIMIDREAENAVYSLDGWSVPESWLSDGVFIAERSVAQAWFDSLTTAGEFPERNR